MNYFFRRFSAFATDLMIVTYLLIIYYFGFTNPFSQFMKYMENKEFDFKFQCFRIIVFILYCTIMEATKIQGTLGKKIFGVKVVDVNYNQISPLNSLIRNLSKIISGVPLFFGYFWAIISPNHQAWHDKIAKTYIVLYKEDHKAKLGKT